MTKGDNPLVELECTNCGATMPPEASTQEVIVCAFCGASFQTKKAKKRRKAQHLRPPPKQRNRPARKTAPAAPATPKKKANNTVAKIIALIAVLGFGVTYAFMHLKETDSGLPAGPSANLAWVDQYAIPAVADANGDGRGDLIALYRDLSDASQNIYTGAFDGHTLERLWKFGPLGIKEACVGKVGLQVAGAHVVVLAPYGKVNLLELSTGSSKGQFQLPTNPDNARLCLLDVEGTEVQVDTLMVIDAATAKARTKGVPPHWHQRPEHCRLQTLSSNTTQGGRQSARSIPKQERPEAIPRHAFKSVLSDGEHGVALLETIAGEPARLLMGFDPKTREELWRVPLRALVDDPIANKVIVTRFLDLGQGAIAFTYDLANGKNIKLPPGVWTTETGLVVLDAETGDKRFETKLASSARGTIADGRLWVPSYPRGIVQIVDLKDGSQMTFGL